MATPPSTKSPGRAYLPGLSSSRRKNVAFVTIVLIAIALVAAIALVEGAVMFRACFGALIFLLVLLQLYASVVLFVNRHNSLLELSQPVGLSLFSLSGSMATAGSFFLTLPEYDVSCALRQPIILLSISFMGSILVARSWRIGCIMSPKLAFASSSGITKKQTMNEKIQAARLKAMGILSKMSKWMLFVSSCGKYKVTHNDTKRMRQQINFADSMRLTFVLIAPQLILQVINASVRPLRMQSIEVDDGNYECQCDIGPLPLILGIIIASMPFFLALLLNVKSEGVPDVVREFDQISTCITRTIGVLLITLPTVSMVAHDSMMLNAYAYLLAASLLSFVFPLCYQIAWLRVYLITIRGEEKVTDILKQSNRCSVARSSTGGAGRDVLETLQAAEDADTIGKMFETIGRVPKSIEVNDDILSMFKKGGGYNCEVGFTYAEINSFGPRTLHRVVSTLISSAKRRGSQMSKFNGKEYEFCLKKVCKYVLEAMSVFDEAPVKNSMKDRSVIFAGYSYMSLLINAGAVTAPDNRSSVDFQNDLGASFVRDTQFQLFHYCRALAMRAELLARNQQFSKALSIVHELKSLYEPALHSSAIVDEYGIDHAANTIAVSALWLCHLNNIEGALDVCKDFIERILPEVKKTNIDNSNLVGLNRAILPILQVIRSHQKDGATRAHELYNTFVVESYKSGSSRESIGKKLIRPITILLKCCSVYYDIETGDGMYQGIEEDIEWMLIKEMKLPDPVETSITNVHMWSFYSLLAEICLHLAKLVSSHEQQRALVKEGIRLSQLADPKMKDIDGNVTNPIAYASHAQIYSELKQLQLF